jgi:hypothetical protein
MPEPGEIYYSPRAARFYQVGRRGAVKNETAYGTLRYDEDAGRFRDQRGRLLDNELLAPRATVTQRWIGRDAEGNAMVRTTMRDVAVDETAARNAQLARNQQLVARVVVRTDDGRVHVYYASTKLGGRQSLDQLAEQAKRNARGDLKSRGYDIDTPTVSGNTMRVDYVKRTVSVR